MALQARGRAVTPQPAPRARASGGLRATVGSAAGPNHRQACIQAQKPTEAAEDRRIGAADTWVGGREALAGAFS